MKLTEIFSSFQDEGFRDDRVDYVFMSSYEGQFLIIL